MSLEVFVVEKGIQCFSWLGECRVGGCSWPFYSLHYHTTPGSMLVTAVVSGIRHIKSHPMMQNRSIWGHWTRSLGGCEERWPFPIVPRIILGGHTASVWLEAIVSAETGNVLGSECELLFGKQLQPQLPRHMVWHQWVVSQRDPIGTGGPVLQNSRWKYLGTRRGFLFASRCTVSEVGKWCCFPDEYKVSHPFIYPPHTLQASTACQHWCLVWFCFLVLGLNSGAHTCGTSTLP